ncbi:MAG: zinc-ribbon domain-containing protein [Candidatus Acidiferrales bacterium]
MPHCTKCGAAVADGTAFCGSCGAPQGTVSGSGAAAPAAPAQAG